MPPEEVDELAERIAARMQVPLALVQRDVTVLTEKVDDIGAFFIEQPGRSSMPSRLTNVEALAIRTANDVEGLKGKHAAVQTENAKGRWLLAAAAVAGLSGWVTLVINWLLGRSPTAGP